MKRAPPRNKTQAGATSATTQGPAFMTKTDFVYQSLNQAIVEGQLKPGERLIIDDMASRFSVSAIPVREALQQLQADGLVEIQPHIGATVSQFSNDAVVELFALMEGLEVIAAEHAAGKMSAEAEQQLTDLINAMEKSGRARQHETWAEQNNAFHLAICGIAHMPTLLELTERVLLKWKRLRKHSYHSGAPANWQEADQEHRQIVALLKGGDTKELVALIRKHNQQALRQYLKKTK
jgi:DNA-binding GntR family transcriptional regulator